VRNRWCEIQAGLFDTAYVMAGEGRQLMDQGLEAEASKLLTDYMEKNTRDMLDGVVELLKAVE
jgi:hypothetical protein